MISLFEKIVSQIIVKMFFDILAKGKKKLKVIFQNLTKVKMKLYLVCFAVTYAKAQENSPVKVQTGCEVEKYKSNDHK